MEKRLVGILVKLFVKKEGSDRKEVRTAGQSKLELEAFRQAGKKHKRWKKLNTLYDQMKGERDHDPEKWTYPDNRNLLIQRDYR